MGLTGHREEAYRFEAFDALGRYLGVLDTVQGGRLRHAYYSSLRTGGSLELAEPLPLDARVRVTYIADGTEYPLGVYIAASRGRAVRGASVTWSAELYSPLVVLSQDCLVEPFVAEEGAVVTGLVRSVAEGVRLALADSALTMRRTVVFEPGSSRLTVANALLGFVGFTALDVDANGTAVAGPYLLPSERPVAWEFREGQAALHRRDLAVDADAFEVPNRVVLVTGGEEPLVSVAEDEDGPLGHAARARWVTDYRTGEEAADQDTLDAKAARVLAEAQGVAEQVRFDHAYVPLRPGAVVRIEDTVAGLSGRFVITEQEHRLAVPGACVTSVARRVL